MMKLNFFPRGIIVLWMFFWPTAASMSQETCREKKTAPDDVLSLAEKTLDAIRNNDVGFVATLPDPTGIYVGFDASKMTATQFRKELAAKNGVYCVIFDSSCAKEFQGSPRPSSLRQMLIAQPVTTTMVMQDAQGVSQVVSVTVRKAANPHEDLFTLYFRQVGKHWRLQHIDYV